MTASKSAKNRMTPVGVWKQIDDKTGTARAQVKITESGGVLTGRIEKLLAKDARHDAVCDKCSDDRKNQPVIGLEILRDLKPTSDPETWDGGTVLSVLEGKIFKCRLRVIEGGAKLEMRGYVGIALVGRTQVWERLK